MVQATSTLVPSFPVIAFRVETNLACNLFGPRQLSLVQCMRKMNEIQKFSWRRDQQIYTLRNLYTPRPSGGLNCRQVCEIQFFEQEEGRINRPGNIDDFAHVIRMMDLLGTWTDSADKSSSASTMSAAMWIHC